MPAHRLARIPDTPPPPVPGSLRRQFPQQGPEPDTASLRLSFKFPPHIVIKTNGDRNTHGFNLITRFTIQ